MSGGARSLSGAFAVAGALVVVSPAATASAAGTTAAQCVAASENAVTLRRSAHLQAARGELLRCADTACPAEVREECARRIAEVNLAMPTLVLEAKDSGGRDLAAVRVTMDGKALVDRLDGTALVVDPGEHVFRFEAEGLSPVETRLVVREGEKERRERVTLGAPPPVVPPPPSPSPPPPPPVIVPQAPPAAQPASRSPVLPWTLAGIGAALGVAGGTLMIVESGKASTARADHDPAAYDAAQAPWTVGLVGVLVGAGVVAGAVVIAVASRGSDSATALTASPWVAAGAGGVRLGGSW